MALQQRQMMYAGGLLLVLLWTAPAVAQLAPYPSYGPAASGGGEPSYYSEDYSGSDSPEAPLDKNTAEIRVRLPERAELWSNGKKTTVTGAVRELVTPELQAERVYTYLLKARWMEDGITVEKTLRVRTFAGNRVTVNFVRRPATPLTQPGLVRAEEPSAPSLPPPDVEQKPLDWSAPPRSFSIRPN